MVQTLDLRAEPVDGEAFDPNTGERTTSGVLFPSAKGMQVLASADFYLGQLRQGLGDAYQELAKANVPPMAFSFSNISYLPDPVGADLIPWPGIAPDSLRKVARENVIPQMVIQTRVADVARYCQLSTHMWKPGWRVELREGGRSPTKAELRDIRECEAFLESCDIDTSDYGVRGRDANLYTPMREFFTQITYDTLRFDGVAVWTDMDNMGRVRAFRALPAGNMRQANPRTGVRGDPNEFMALLDETNTPVMGFTRDQLIWKVRNTRPDPGIFSYGYSELEASIRLIQGFQSAIDLNVDSFSRNAIPNGIMLLKGDFWTQNQVDILMREMNNAKKGITKAWGVPILGVPKDSEIEMMPLMDLKGTDVRYKDHLNMMAGAFCCLLGFPISRLGYKTSGQHHDSAPLPDESVEMVGDDDPGLPPLLLFYEDILNPYIVWSRWPHLCFRFTGKSPKQDAREYEGRRNASTWGEERAHADQEPLEKQAPEGFEELAKIMSMCPTDPSKVGAFTTIASRFIEVKYGKNESGEAEINNQPFNSSKDPARSEAHGKTSGVRRNSSAEKGK
jgi:hypothetical protein